MVSAVSRSSAACTAGACDPSAPAGSVICPVTRSGASAEAVALLNASSPSTSAATAATLRMSTPGSGFRSAAFAQAVGT